MGVENEVICDLKFNDSFECVIIIFERFCFCDRLVWVVVLYNWRSKVVFLKFFGVVWMLWVWNEFNFSFFERNYCDVIYVWFVFFFWINYICFIFLLLMYNDVIFFEFFIVFFNIFLFIDLLELLVFLVDLFKFNISENWL